MPNIEIAAMTGRKVVLNAEAIEQFRNGLRGGHLIRGDDGYEPAQNLQRDDRASTRNYRPLRRGR